MTQKRCAFILLAGGGYQLVAIIALVVSYLDGEMTRAIFWLLALVLGRRAISTWTAAQLASAAKLTMWREVRLVKRGTR